MNKKRITLFITALGFLSFGIYNGDCKAVLSKAATICLECIGIG